MNIYMQEIFLMFNSTYLYTSLILLVFCFIFYFFINYRPGKSDINNKLLLKKLLEGLEMDLPEELKGLENTSNDPQKYRNF